MVGKPKPITLPGLLFPQHGLAQPGVMYGHRLLLEKMIYLPLMVNVIVSSKTASRVRCILWFLANIQVRVRVYHHGLIRALAGWARRTIYLMMGEGL